jgi:hypothetical protein
VFALFPVALSDSFPEKMDNLSHEEHYRLGHNAM